MSRSRKMTDSPSLLPNRRTRGSKASSISLSSFIETEPKRKQNYDVQGKMRSRSPEPLSSSLSLSSDSGPGRDRPLRRSFDGTKKIRLSPVPNRIQASHPPHHKSYLDKGPSDEQKDRRNFLKDTLFTGGEDPLDEADDIPLAPTHSSTSSLPRGRSLSPRIAQRHSKMIKVAKSNARRRSIVRRFSFGSSKEDSSSKLKRADSSSSLQSVHSLQSLPANAFQQDSRSGSVVVDLKAIKQGKDWSAVEPPATGDGIVSNAIRRVVQRRRMQIAREKTEGIDLHEMRRSLRQLNVEDDADDELGSAGGYGFLKNSLMTLEKLYVDGLGQ